jgi:chromate reductase, NAD(P)H dehydrogenase (quinone)
MISRSADVLGIAQFLTRGASMPVSIPAMRGERPIEPLRYLVFAGSLRRDSHNKKLADLAAVAIRANGGETDVASMADFDVPSYNQDVEDQDGFPPGAEEFRRRLEGCHAFVVAAPEYNNSIPGLLKNAIDWVSRFRPQPFNERHGLLMSASPSMVGGNRGLWALRIPLEHLGARIYPDMFSLAQAHLAFGTDGQLEHEELRHRFDANISNFMNLVEASERYPCVKRAWVEYLGERPEPSLDRVE